MQSGLLKGGFWNYLREDITFSLFNQCPLKMDLAQFPTMQEDLKESDQDRLNSITLLLANVINMVFNADAPSPMWDSLVRWVEDWYNLRHPRSLPYSKGDEIPGAFPFMWFFQPCNGKKLDAPFSLRVFTYHGR